MYINEKIDGMISDFSNQMKRIFEDKLCDIILFGSYARGDFDSESDVDIAILADILRENESEYNSQIVKAMENIYDKYGYSVVLSPVIINNSFFNEWKEHLPFYKNVATEGVRIVA